MSRCLYRNEKIMQDNDLTNVSHGIHSDLRVETTERYLRWLKSIRDPTTLGRILFRVDRLIHGNPGDCKSVGAGVFELRIDFEPGYRVYYVHRAGVYVLLIAGGDKATQRSDIRSAIALAKELERTPR